KPYSLDGAKEALTEIGVEALTLYEVKGLGRQKGFIETYRGAAYAVDFVPKIKLELVLPEDAVERLVRTIASAARTGAVGDGIVALPVEGVVPIRSGGDGRNRAARRERAPRRVGVPN